MTNALADRKDMTTRDVAKHYGVETRDVVYAARRGRIKGRKIGWQWVFDGKDLPSDWPIKRRTEHKEEWR